MSDLHESVTQSDIQAGIDSLFHYSLIMLMPGSVNERAGPRVRE